jgi:hypothetical protein
MGRESKVHKSRTCRECKEEIHATPESLKLHERACKIGIILGNVVIPWKERKRRLDRWAYGHGPGSLAGRGDL